MIASQEGLRVEFDSKLGSWSYTVTWAQKCYIRGHWRSFEVENSEKGEIRTISKINLEFGMGLYT